MSPMRRPVLRSRRVPLSIKHPFLCFLALVFAVGVHAVPSSAEAQEEPPASLRIGVLEFGTVRWTLDVVEHHGLAAEHGLDLEIVPLGSTNAVTVALQGGAVDVIVSDWIWVSRQRAEGRDYVFRPYSVAVGGVVVNPEAGISELEDLRGKRFGVAGGPVDKSWLLLRAYARKQLGEDMAQVVEPTYAAPPLLNSLMLRGRLPAVLNYWHYSARLEAAGMQPMLSVDEILKGLGISEQVPVLGWVFDEQWGRANRQTLDGFFEAVDEAMVRLAESDDEWERIRPLTKAENDAVLAALREGYRAGIPGAWGPPQVEAARSVFEILVEEGGRDLAGRGEGLSAGTFWGVE